MTRWTPEIEEAYKQGRTDGMELATEPPKEGLMNREPAIIIGGLEAIALAIIGLVAYIAGWEGELTALVLAVVAPTIALIGAVLTRRKVTPV